MQGNQAAKLACPDSQLIAAVTASRSWRGVMRALGLGEDSPRSIQLIRRHAERLGLDTSHFTGQRRWSDAALEQALSRAQSWAELLTELGLSHRSASTRLRIKAHAERLGLDTCRLDPQAASHAGPPCLKPDMSKLRDAGTTIAAAWFLLRGCGASIPVEPAIYGWVVQVGRRPYSASNQARLIPYDSESLDFFFILDGDLNIYVIPSQVIAGRVVIVLRRYRSYIVGSAAGLWGESLGLP